jgi:hypothetical protein
MFSALLALPNHRAISVVSEQQHPEHSQHDHDDVVQ